MTAAEKAKAIADMEERLSGDMGNALLYLGQPPVSRPELPDLFLDSEFRAEIDRRMLIETGDHPPPLALNLVSPRYFHEFDGGAKK
jgi:hypothetical protein